MADGSTTPIEHIEPGDLVLAGNPHTGQWANREVLDQWSHLDHGEMVTVTLEDGTSISATDHHLFWVDNLGRWLEIEHTKPGDHLLTPNGVTTIAHVAETAPKQTLVWELTVDTDHTFTVSPTPVLVHNAGQGPDGCFGKPSAKPENYDGREWDDLLVGGKLPASGPEFDRWWDQLSVQERKYLTSNSDLFAEIKKLAGGDTLQLAQLARGHRNVGKNRTAAGGVLEIAGKEIESVLSWSADQNLQGFVDLPKDRIFPTNRPTDAEYKILEYAAQQLDDGLNPRPPFGEVLDGPRGTLDIIVDSAAPDGGICDECSSVIREFQDRYPNVTLNVRVQGKP
jgi:hypothetical protein